MKEQMAFMEIDELLKTTAILTLFWSLTIEGAKRMLFRTLPSKKWWKRTVLPQRQMMYNFGYPRKPTPEFPEGVTEEMVREAFCFVLTICGQHFLSAIVMLPLVIHGWENSSNIVRRAFVLGTLSDLAFDIYDWSTSTLRAFTPRIAKKLFNYDPLPKPFWIVICVLHHPLAMSLIVPMTMSYVQLTAYHQLAFSLLFAASLCYALGSYKFTLDLSTSSGFIQYKVIILLQLFVILITRFFLWFPNVYYLLMYFHENSDPKFFIFSAALSSFMSIFNLLLLADAVGAAVKWLPKPKPTSDSNAGDYNNDEFDLNSTCIIPPTLAVFVARKSKQRFKAAAHSVIAANRLARFASDKSD